MTNETDRELLELAAKAAGLVGEYGQHSDDYYYRGNMEGIITDIDYKYQGYVWNPLDDDSDALRLAVNLDIDIEQNKAFKRSCAMWWGYEVLQLELFEEWGSDKHAATRRAIVRAAAEIGKAMK